MKFFTVSLLLLMSFVSFGQDTVSFINFKEKTFDIILPTYGEIKLKNGDKIKGLIKAISNEQIVINTITQDEGTLREAKKNKILTDAEREDMLYIFKSEHVKADVKSISVTKKRNATSSNIKKIGLYTLMGLTLAAGSLATITDLNAGRAPGVGIGAVVIIGILFLLINKTSSKKLDFYKWKIK
jgi:hypothetical protein